MTAEPASSAASSAIEVVPVKELDLAFAPCPWPFAQQRRAEIDAYFARCQRERPALWNGRVLILHQAKIAGGVFHGAYTDVDFASFLAWRDWGFPDPSMRNCFAMAALATSDDAYMLGVMGAHTANAGKIYFPSGTPDLADIVDGRVDLAGSVIRELREETGLLTTDMDAASGWYAVFAGSRIAMMKPVRVRASAEEVRARARAHIAHDAEPELADILIVRSEADLLPQVPPFVTAFLIHMWSR